MRETALAATRNDAVNVLQHRVDELLGNRSTVRVLDAGCGPRTTLRYPTGAYVMGIDNDARALARNQRVDEPVLADLETYELPQASFDLIVSWYVFEHLARPDAVLKRLSRAVRPGGLIVLAIPNLWSPKSLVTKFTPHSVHVWFRRRVLGRPLAGTPGYPPYPTTLRLSIAPDKLLRLAGQFGLKPVHVGWFEDEKQEVFRRRLRITGTAWRVVQATVTAASGGRLDAARTEVLILFQRHT